MTTTRMGSPGAPGPWGLPVTATRRPGSSVVRVPATDRGLADHREKSLPPWTDGGLEKRCPPLLVC